MKLYSFPLIVFFIGNLVSLSLIVSEHEFIGDIKQKTNSDNTVTKKTTITLNQCAYKFSRTKFRKNVAYFNCRNKKKGCKANAIATITEDHNLADNYILDQISTSHTCQDNMSDRNKDKFKKSMKDKIKANPMSQPIPELYSEVRNTFCKDMSPETKRQFLISVGKFSDIATSLYSVQHSFVPQAPRDQLELDTLSDWFNYQDETNDLPAESMILEDRYKRSIGRTIVFSTSQHLKLLSTARGISGDGTFRITPRYWRQVFVISAEIDKGVFVPCVFALLPTKEKEGYDEMFDIVAGGLEKQGLTLSADYFNSDYEIAIRKGWSNHFRVPAKGCMFHYSQVRNALQINILKS